MKIGGQNRIRAPKAGLLYKYQLIVLAILLAVSVHGRADQGPLVAAASSLRSLWPALAERYTRDTEQPAPRVSFASSGLLATQIVNGAPFELFLSADLASINRLPTSKLASPPQLYALGDLHLVVPLNSPIARTLSLDSLAWLIGHSAEGPSARLAIPNPVHAPYGQAAQEALVSAGIWPLPAQQLLAAENAAQTLQFLRSGAVDAAIVPQALVFAYGEGVESVVVPPDSYEPVEHTLAVFENAGESARQFSIWLLGPNAAIVFNDAGLRSAQVPGER